MAALSFFIGIIGNIISILVFVSPIKTFCQVVKKKSTENYRGDPYITTLLSTSLWTFYGLLKPGALLVVTVNGAGAVLQFIYVILFLIFAPKTNRIKIAKLVAILDVGFLGAVITGTLVFIHGNLRLTFVGILCAALTIGMYASPLLVARTVINTRSVKYMPFLLSFFLFLNAGIWSAYAVLVRDFYIGVPNAIGFVLGLVQLIIYSKYRNKSKSTRSTEKMEEEGSAPMVKGTIEMRGLGDDDHDEETNHKNRTALTKGKSLPKPSVDREYSLKKILKTSSLGSYDLCSTWPNDEPDVEMGNIEDHN